VGRGIAEGVAALRTRPTAICLVGADVVGSFVYGAQTVVFVMVARQAGLGLHGYGYLFAAVGVGALAGTALAGRVLRLPARAGAAIAMGVLGLSMIAMPGARLGVVAVVLAGASGLGSILVEVMAETSLQRTLPEDVFGRAYGLAIPAAVAGIAVGSLSASALVSSIGLNGTLTACGSVALAYGVLLVGRRPTVAASAAPAAPTAQVSSASLAAVADRGPGGKLTEHVSFG
jgi:hypothetical protein